MKIGIQQVKGSFSDRWISYCEENNIPYKLVNCYRSDIIDQLSDCDALMWHFHHEKNADHLFAKQLLFAVHAAGKIIFPDINSCWHFDDKVAQKYLLESLQMPMVISYVFYDKSEAMQWLEKAEFPLVFKLRSGSASSNVKLIHNRKQAGRVIKKAFGRGFPPFDKFAYMRERRRKTVEGLDNWIGTLKGVARLFIRPGFTKLFPKQIGYVYFQDFVPGNTSDIRVIVIGEKAFAIKRLVRKNDFRASGSGAILYDYLELDERCVKIAFEASEHLQAGCMTYDFVFDKDHTPLIVEISYGFKVKGYDPCSGYWDRSMNWHKEKFNPQAWMVESVIKK